MAWILQELAHIDHNLVAAVLAKLLRKIAPEQLVKPHTILPQIIIAANQLKLTVCEPFLDQPVPARLAHVVAPHVHSKMHKE